MGEGKQRYYVGNGKQVEGHDYLVSASLSITDINAYLEKNPIQPYKNGKVYLNITIARNKMPDRFGHTHTISVNEFKPRLKERIAEDKLDDVPF
jgi:hypothetical protein